MKDAFLLVMVTTREMGDEGTGEGSRVRFKEDGLVRMEREGGEGATHEVSRRNHVRQREQPVQRP